MLHFKYKIWNIIKGDFELFWNLKGACFALFKYKYNSWIDVDYTSDIGDHEESTLMTDETFFPIIVLLQVYYAKTMDIFWHSPSYFPSLFYFSPPVYDDEDGDENLNLGSATFTVCRCNLSPGYSPILPFVIRGTRTSRQRRRQRRSSTVRQSPRKKGHFTTFIYFFLSTHRAIKMHTRYSFQEIKVNRYRRC